MHSEHLYSASCNIAYFFFVILAYQADRSTSIITSPVLVATLEY